MKRKIKIIHVIADAELGGGPRHVLGILRYLDKDRFECSLVCPKGYLANEAKKISGVEVQTLEFKSKFDWATFFKLRSILRKIQVDHDPFGPTIIHSHGPRAGLFARLWRLTGTRHVYTEHVYSENYRVSNPINALGQKLMLSMLNRRTEIIMAVSPSVKKFLVAAKIAPEKKIRVIPNGLDEDLIRLAKISHVHRPQGKMVVGSIGNLFPAKGQADLIKAFGIVHEHYPESRLELIGDGPEMENLHKLIGMLRLHKSVALLGRKDSIETFLKEWSVAVFPSLSETFGLAALETMAHGIPVVVTNISAFVDLTAKGETGILVPPANPDRLAKAIVKILQDPKLAHEYAERGRKRSGQFDWREIVAGVESAYDDLFAEMI